MDYIQSQELSVVSVNIAPHGNHMVCLHRHWIALSCEILCVTLWAVEPVGPGIIVESDNNIVSLNRETAESKIQVDPDRMSWPLRKRLICYGIAALYLLS